MKIFVGDVLLHIVKKKPETLPYEPILVSSGLEIIAVYEQIVAQGMATSREYHFLPDDYKKVTTEFKNRFELILAAGGVVMKKDKVLFMKRLGKWDLPKGKIDKGENTAQAALREVEEECGIKAKILYKIGNTWHTFIQADKSHKLKKTAWYAMICLEDAGKKPQEEEGITKVKWVEEEKVQKKLDKSYSSIVHIFDKFLKKETQRQTAIDAQVPTKVNERAERNS